MNILGESTDLRHNTVLLFVYMSDLNEKMLDISSVAEHQIVPHFVGTLTI